MTATSGGDSEPVQRRQDGDLLVVREDDALAGRVASRAGYRGSRIFVSRRCRRELPPNAAPENRRWLLLLLSAAASARGSGGITTSRFSRCAERSSIST